MFSTRRVIARLDFAIELAVPRRLARAAWVADWLRHLATVIERGDSPRSEQGAGARVEQSANEQAAS